MVFCISKESSWDTSPPQKFVNLIIHYLQIGFSLFQPLLNIYTLYISISIYFNKRLFNY